MSKFFISSAIFILLLGTNFLLSYALSCSSDCNHGHCISPGMCLCEPGYFNLYASCDTEVLSLLNKQYTQKIIPADGWLYFYISLYNITNNLQLRFQFQSGAAAAYIVLQSQNLYKLPTANDEPLLITPTIDGGEHTISKLITKQEVKATGGGWLTLALHNDGTSQAIVKVQYIATANPNDDSDDGDLMSSDHFKRTIIALIVCGVGVGFCFATCIASKRRKRRLINQQRMHRQVNLQSPRRNYELVIPVDQSPQNRQDQSQGTPHAPPILHLQSQRVPQHLQAALLQVQQQKRFLSKKELQKYFSKRPFSQLKSSFHQTSCSICLEDFKPESLCHELYCFHIFHEACIEGWLAKHDSCPDCRKPITREAIKKFFREEKKRRKEQGQSGDQGQRTPSL